tara:strand:- start:895 stop:1131 length:237 start_codon:yes stop_codon:yes gene_type:complete
MASNKDEIKWDLLRLAGSCENTQKLCQYLLKDGVKKRSREIINSLKDASFGIDIAWRILKRTESAGERTFSQFLDQET